MILRRTTAVLAALVLLAAASRPVHATPRSFSGSYTHSQPLLPLEDAPRPDAPADDLTMPVYRELASSQLAAAGTG